MRVLRLKSWHFLVALLCFTLCIYFKANRQMAESARRHCLEIKELYEEQDLCRLTTNISIILFVEDNSDLCLVMESNLCLMMEAIDKDVNSGFYKINTARCSNVCMKYKIEGVPSILILKDGVEVKRIMGVISVSNLNMIYQRIQK